MTKHQDHHFSVTVKTDDVVALGCLRAIAKYSQRTGNNQIPWGGTKDSEWKRASNRATFRFTSREYRDIFKAEVARLLPNTLYDLSDERDDDPATPRG